MQRYNVQTHPWLSTVSLPHVSLAYTRHATARASAKGIGLSSLPSNLAGRTWQLVEAESVKPNGPFTKLVLRARYNDRFDLVLVIVPARPGHACVVTCWLNRADDTHITLNHGRLTA